MSGGPPLSPEDLADRFQNPDRRFGPLPLWWWSGETLELQRLTWQLDQLLAGGISQAVVMSLAPTGPLYGALADDPPFMSSRWWARFRGVCDYARERGFQIWIYDQLGFSGANLQGRIVADHPHLAGRRLASLRRDASNEAVTLRVPVGAEGLGAWFVGAHGSGTRPLDLNGDEVTVEAEPGEVVLAFAVTQGFDYFSQEACAKLIDRVYGEYERHAGDFFGDVIAGAFQDELPDVPGWSAAFETDFEAHAGYDLLPHLPALFGDPLADRSVDAERVRIDYHRVRAALARRAFFDPLASWLDARGLPCGFDQQSPAREGSPTGGVVQYADYLETHARFRIPGNDHWGDAKVHSSLAHAHGHESVWLEGFYLSGWGGTLEETYDWLAPFFRRGATLYDPHAVYYSTRAGWFEWAPPSTCWRQPYWPDYPTFARAVTRLSSLLTAGHHVASTVLYNPTEFVQSAALADRSAAAAAEAEHLYRELDGIGGWISEQPGVLDRAGIDYDSLNAHGLAPARVDRGDLVLGVERYRNVILPGSEILDAGVARVLADLAETGGRVVVVGRPPRRLVGELGTSDEPGPARDDVLGRLHRNSIVVESPGDVPEQLLPSTVHVLADAPVLHRQVGDLHVITAVAHDGLSGTVQPIVPDLGVLWNDGTYSWTNYWSQLRGAGYSFVPPGDRPLTINIDGPGASGWTAQSWDPRTGLRRPVPSTPTVEGLRIESGFDAGTFALVVVGPELPEPTAPPIGLLQAHDEVTGEWEMLARSTLDNSWGDLDAIERGSLVPIQVWSFDHAVDGGPTQPAIATFGPFAEIAEVSAAGDGTNMTWSPLMWSLSRGIRKDPIHDQSLGPNGYVPEEFILVRDLEPGAVRRIRTTISVPDDPAVRLGVGANARRQVRFRGEDLPVDGAGYLSFSAIPPGEGLLELEFTATDRGDLRAFFALTTRPDRFRRPEWVVADDEPSAATTVTIATVVSLAERPTDARIQLSTESPTILIVNGVEVGLQSAFDPESYSRMTRVHPYDLSDVLVAGPNTIEVRITDTGRPASFRCDSVPAEFGGLGLLSGIDWTATRDGSPVPLAARFAQYDDPRYGCIVPRPHPLQSATWLETAAKDSTVVDLVPDIAPRDGRTETLTFILPIGTTRLTVPSTEPFEADFGVTDHTVVLLPQPASAGQLATLRFRPESGRRGGALLTGPIIAEVEPAMAPLAPWEALGLGALGGEVRYRARINLPTTDAAQRTVINLGAVRGTAEVRVNGEVVASLFAGPWRVELPAAISVGRNADVEVIIRGTLAPYLDVASPTSAIAAGQTITGLLGPVSVEVWS